MIEEISLGSTVTYVISALVIGYILYSFFKVRRQMSRPPSENTLHLTDKDFNQVISKGVTLVDFWAEWCGPCKVQGPIIDEIADEMKDEVKIAKLDVDHNPGPAQKLGVQNIPTLIIFKDGKPVERLVGVKPKGQIIKLLKKHLEHVA
ncbi:MAG: hypothetical protein Kow00127_08100 [Bacteroidales bacterium]